MFVRLMADRCPIVFDDRSLTIVGESDLAMISCDRWWTGFSDDSFLRSLVEGNAQRSFLCNGSSIRIKRFFLGNGQKRELPVGSWPETGGQKYEGSKH